MLAGTARTSRLYDPLYQGASCMPARIGTGRWCSECLENALYEVIVTISACRRSGYRMVRACSDALYQDTIDVLDYRSSGVRWGRMVKNALHQGHVEGLQG